MSRLYPNNPGNARLLYVDGNLMPCDVCDEKREAAILETIGGPAGCSRTLRICRECIKELNELMKGL